MRQERPHFITPRAMRFVDRLAQERYGIAPLILMENAGRSVACEAQQILRRGGSRVVCVCGSGNNGGDGFVAARHLLNVGIEAAAFLVGKRPKGDAGINCGILERMGVDVTPLDISGRQISYFRRCLAACGLIIDAIFGTGFHGGVDEPFAGVIRAMNNSGKRILSVDIPSGLDAFTGRASQPCVKADATVTFGLAKTGFVKNDGPKYTGRIVVADISLPQVLLVRYGR